eukprot:scaffold2400_cov187-Cylindrotheca_fusiformis.AAC.4
MTTVYDKDPVISKTTRVHDSEGKELGIIRYHYDSSPKKSACSTILILGVGTSMSVSDYDKLSWQVAMDTSIFIVFADHNEHEIIKTSPERFAHLANAISDQIALIAPFCSNEGANIMIGGHSASGEASMKALQNGLYDFRPHGFVGLDPFEVSTKTFGTNENIIGIPSINWGFTKTTCLVTREKAAAGAYQRTLKAARVLYAIENKHNGCKITHCVFSDHGCGVSPFSCSTHEEYEWVFGYVANSIHLFVDAVREDLPFSKQYFQLETEHEVIYYVNNDEIEGMDANETTAQHSNDTWTTS